MLAMLEKLEINQGSLKYINAKIKNRTKTSLYATGELCHICNIALLNDFAGGELCHN